MEPTVALAQQVLGGMGKQLRLGIEELDADLDVEFARMRGVPLRDRLADVELVMGSLLARFRAAGVAYVLEGDVAAAFHGAPCRPRRLDVARLVGRLLTLPPADRAPGRGAA